MSENQISRNSNALVSIIMPAHNAGRFIAATLESISRQTYKNWELTITEDGTSDETAAIVERFRETHPGHTIHFLRHPEARGQGSARNTAIRAARGEFLAFLDSDDLWTEEHLARAVKVLTETGADFTFCPHLNFEGVPAQTHGPYGKDDAQWGPFPDCLYVHCYIIPSAAVVRRSAMEKAGLFDEDRRVQSGEDLEMWLRLAGHGCRFEYQPVATCLYRTHLQAVSKNKTRMAETKAWAIWKNRDAVKEVSPEFRHRRTATVCEEAARANRATRPDKAAGYYLMALRANPRPKYLAYLLACMAYAVLRLRFPPLVLKPSGWNS